MVDLARGEHFSFLGFDVPAGAEPTRRLAGVVSTSAEEADSPSAEAEGHLSAVSIPTDRAGGGADQPDPARLGAVLCCRRCQSVLWFCQRLGGKESPASSDACTETAGLRLEEVEEAVALQAPGLVQRLPGAAPTKMPKALPA